MTVDTAYKLSNLGEGANRVEKKPEPVDPQEYTEYRGYFAQYEADALQREQRSRERKALALKEMDQ
jgi:hypothetical protein